MSELNEASPSLGILEETLAEHGITLTSLLGNLEFEPVDAVFASGSLVEGFGNATSDLDLFVIHKNAVLKETHVVFGTPVEVICVNSLRLDVEYWREETVVDLAKKISTVDLVSRVDVSMSWHELDFCHRLRIGIPLFNKAGFMKLKSKFDFDKLVDILVTKYIRQCEGTIEDCIGALKAQEYETAFLMARSATEFAVEAYLASVGETNVSSKWRFKKLERAFTRTSDIYQKAWRLETPSLSGREEVEQYAKEALAFTNDLLIKAQLR